MNRRRLLTRFAVAVISALAVLVTGNPALASDSWTKSSYHIGDLCTQNRGYSGCDGSVTFQPDGEHLYIWDNYPDGHSVAVRYYREDACSTGPVS